MFKTLQGSKLLFIAAFLLLFVKGEVSFSVDEVQPLSYPIEDDVLVDAKQALQSKMRHNVQFMGWDSEHDKLYRYSGELNSFLDTVYRAYANHFPLTLSPDHVWTAIIQAFGIHVRQNSEKLRSKFVSFDGKQELKVERNYLPQGTQWQSVLQEFNDLIKGFVGDKVYDIISPNFTTTGDLERAVANVAIMDTFQNYFSLHVSIWCGIPEITLLGSVEDWEMILQKFKKLTQFDLKFWVDELSPILEEFVKASKGNINRSFWQQIFSEMTEMDFCVESTKISGWVIKFFPYLKHDRLAPWAIKRPVNNNNYNNNNNNQSTQLSEQLIEIESTDFPSGISSAPVKLTDDIKNYDLKFYSGFVGFTQVKGNQKINFSLKPNLGWAVVEESDLSLRYQFLGNLSSLELLDREF